MARWWRRWKAHARLVRLRLACVSAVTTGVQKRRIRGAMRFWHAVASESRMRKLTLDLARVQILAAAVAVWQQASAATARVRHSHASATSRAILIVWRRWLRSTRRQRDHTRASTAVLATSAEWRRVRRWREAMSALRSESAARALYARLTRAAVELQTKRTSRRFVDCLLEVASRRRDDRVGAAVGLNSQRRAGFNALSSNRCASS